jgi:hypothetical protein
VTEKKEEKGAKKAEPKKEAAKGAKRASAPKKE